MYFHIIWVIKCQLCVVYSLLYLFPMLHSEMMLPVHGGMYKLATKMCLLGMDSDLL